MYKIRISKYWSIPLLLIFLINFSLSPTSLQFPDSDLQNRDGIQDAVQNQNPRFEYDITAVTPNQRGFSKAMANGIPTLTEWWDTDFDYRKMINVTEPDTIARSQEPVTFNVNFAQGFARNNSLRIAFYNSSGWFPVASQVWENSTFYGGAFSEYYDDITITFFVDSTISQEQTYYLYYDDDDQGLPSFTDYINATAANGPATDDPTGYPNPGDLPWVYNSVTGTNLTDVDTIYIATTANRTHAAILLTDYLRDGSDWGGASCALITANYGNSDALDTNNGTTNDEYFVMGDLALDHDAAGDPMSDDSTNRGNVAPNNPIEAWVPGAGVWITDDGPLFTRIKIVTSDGGYQDNNNFMYSPEGDETGDYIGSRNDRGASGFVNYTFEYTFYYHGDNLFANIGMDIEINTHHGYDPIATKNYDDWPHVMSLGGSGTTGSVDVRQNRKAWTSSLNFTTSLLNGSTDPRWWDLPTELWACWYDDSTEPEFDGTGDPSIGIVAKADPLGWEVFSLAVGGVGDNLVLQRKITYGWFGDFFTLYNGTVLSYDYYVFTSAYGTNYTEIRDFSSKINNPMEISLGVEELYEHNILTVQTMAYPYSWPADKVSNVNVTIEKPGYSDWGLTNVNGEYQFTKVPDGIGVNAYTITSTYTIGANPAYTVNVTTNYDINHSIDRSPTLQINCDLSRLQITATNADGGNPLVDAVVRMRRAPPNHLEFVENTTGAGGITNFILYNGTSSESYTVEVEYPVGRPATEVTPSTIAIPDADQMETLDCVIDSHATALNPIYPASAFVSVTPNETVDFQVRYIDTTADPDEYIDGASIYNCTLWNVTDEVLVSFENATDEGNGYYNYSVDMRTLDPTKAYTLKFTLDKDSPIDYSPASFVYSISIVLIQTELTIVSPGYTWVSSVGVNVSITLLYQTATGVPLDGALVQIHDQPGTNVTIFDVPTTTNSTGHADIIIQANYQGAWVTTFNVTKQYYATGYTFFTLATGATPAHLVITNQGTQKSIRVGGSVTLNMRYETTPTPGTGLTAESWNINIDPSGTWVPTPTGTLGDYTVTLTPPGVGTYTIVFTAKRSGYTDGVTFFTVLVKLRPTDLEITSPRTAEILAEDSYPLKVRYIDTLSEDWISGGKVTVAVTPSTGITVTPGEDIGEGIYLIDLQGDAVGTYTVTVTLKKSRYQVASVNFFLTVKPIPTTLNILELQGTNLTTSLAQPINETFWVTLNFTRAENASRSVDNASLTLLGIEEWQMVDYLGNGTYLVEVNTGEVLGIYPILVMASKSNFEIGRASFELQVRPFSTELLLWEREDASATVPVGETLELEVYYNNTDRGVPISEAELVISGLPLTNERSITWEQIGDIYRVSIGTGILPETKPFTLTITGRHPPQFDQASMNFELTIITIPFRAQNQPPAVPGAEPTLAQSISVVEDQEANVTIQLWDTYHNTPIEEAEVIWTLYVPETEAQGMGKAAAGTATIHSAAVQSPEDDRASGKFEYIGNGTYAAYVPSKDLDPGTYRLEVSASKELYGEQTFTMDYVVTPKPGTPTYYFWVWGLVIMGSIGGFYSWYFYFRWPPQVRYIRKALKRVEAGSQVEEGRFPSKEEHRQAITEEQLRLPRQLAE